MTRDNNSTKEMSELAKEQWVTPQATVLSTQETLAGSSGSYDGSGYEDGSS